MRRLPFEQRRAELIDAAVRVIARDGLAAASVRAIVAEANMPVGAFHYVFRSQDHLLRTLITEVAAEERNAVMSALESRPAASLEEMLRAAFLAYLERLDSDPDREIAVLEVSLHGARANSDLVASQWDGYFDVAAESLQRGAELCGAVWTVPVDEVARSLISTLDGLTLTWLAIRDGDAARRHVDFLARSFAALADGDASVARADEPR